MTARLVFTMHTAMACLARQNIVFKGDGNQLHDAYMGIWRSTSLPRRKSGGIS